MYYPVIIATHLPSTVCNIYFIVNHMSDLCKFFQKCNSGNYLYILNYKF